MVSMWIVIPTVVLLCVALAIGQGVVYYLTGEHD